jgi:VWFA-related protein
MRGIALAVLVFGGLSGQQPTFRATVQLVTVPVVVTSTGRDKLITSGLNASDFRIFEDGVEQRVSVFTQDRRAASICVVVDASGSMAVAHRHELGITALQQVVRALTVDDEVAIVRFADHTLTQLPWTRRLDARKATWRLDPDAGLVVNSSITDAVTYALNLIDRAANPRRVILVISDGYENNSVTPLSRVARTRAQSEAIVYAFNPSGPIESAPGGGSLANVLPQIVGDSGGVMLNIANEAEASLAAQTLLSELNFQYTLGYESARPMDGSYRRIKVDIDVPGLVARHRGGYLAQRTP